MEENVYIDGEVLPSILEKLVNSLGRWYNSTLTDQGPVAEQPFFLVNDGPYSLLLSCVRTVAFVYEGGAIQ